MRYREPFTVYRRTLPSGKKVFYYQTYDKNGRRTPSYSTGRKTRSAAKAYCYELMKEGKLIPNAGGNITFNVFSKDWWDWEKCEYLAYRRTRGNVSRSYAQTAKLNLDKHILPTFGNTRLNQIKTYDIEKWLDSFAKKGLANATAKLCLKFLRTMLNEAIRRGLISENPASSVKPLKKENNETGILTNAEVEKLFLETSKKKLWTDDIFYFGNLLSACTGMRLGEVLGVRGEVLNEDYILVNKQFHKNFGLTDTKNHGERKVVIPAELFRELNELSERNNQGYIFSQDGGQAPVHGDTMRRSLQRALKKIGINEEERKSRRVSFHSWRHYLNTTLRSNNITDGKLRAMVGHSSSKMTEHYTHFTPDDFKDIQEIQTRIINISKAG